MLAGWEPGDLSCNDNSPAKEIGHPTSNVERIFFFLLKESYCFDALIHGLNFRYQSPGKSSFGNIFLREEIRSS